MLRMADSLVPAELSIAVMLPHVLVEAVHVIENMNMFNAYED